MDNKINAIKQWLGQGSINLFGRPFSGKDTQAEILAKHLDAPIISGGEILRSHPDQVEIQEIMSAGGIIPSELFIEIIVPYLSDAKLSNTPLVLDTIGRSAGEEKVVVEATNRSGHPLKAVLLLDIDEQDVWDRFDQSQKSQDRGSRADDSKDSIVQRLEKFKSKTQPVIDAYENMGLLVRINGRQSKQEVADQIIDKLYEQASS